MNMGDLQDDEQQPGCAGLCLRLDAAQIKALGLGKHLPAAGAKVSIRASATVKRAADEPEAESADAASESGEMMAGQERSGDEKQSAGKNTGDGAGLELHLTKLELTPVRKEAANVLYGGGD